MRQARELIDRMKNDPNVDFFNDWKVVTILSGNNDLCYNCLLPVSQCLWKVDLRCDKQAVDTS